MNLTTLFLVFVKFGCISFGGGFVLVPILIAEMVEKRHVISMEVFGNLVSIAQVTPGPIGINSATYIGYLQGGIPGALLASLGLIFPSLVLGPLAFYSIARWKDSLLVSGMLKGIRPASLALVFFAVFLFMGMSVFTAQIPFDAIWNGIKTGTVSIPADFRISPGGLGICAAAMLLMWKTKLSSTVLILLSAAAGALFCR
ncbi:MAG: chromate transporter [Lentisphaeria bacterium]|nr:chromate transporter [Lentisphaeria bacterium]